MEATNQYPVLVDNNRDVARALGKSYLLARDEGSDEIAAIWRAAIACYAITAHSSAQDPESSAWLQTTADRLIAFCKEGVTETLTEGIVPRTELTRLLKDYADKGAWIACNAHLLAREQGDTHCAAIWRTVISCVVAGVNAEGIHCPNAGASILAETSNLIGQVEDELTYACIYC